MKYFLIFLFIFKTLHAQVNTEIYRTNSIKKYSQNIESTIKIKKGNSDLIEIKLNHNSNYKFNNHDLFTVFEFESSDLTNKLRNGFFHARLITKVKRKIWRELFIQNEFDNSQNLENRKLIGYGRRYKINSKYNLNEYYYGISLLVSNEKYTNPKDKKQLTWLSQYLSFEKKIGPNIMFKSINYIQLNDYFLKNYRFLSETKLLTKISRQVYLNSSLKFKYLKKVHSLNKHYDISFNQGLSYQF